MRLMAEHPPMLRDPNKLVVFDVACPAEAAHEGEITYLRWPALEWNVNFADCRLFTAYEVPLDSFSSAQPANRQR
ncbi:MAG: hypothetical protein ACYC7F_01370 [Gemmatimonadaceae bacterium]